MNKIIYIFTSGRIEKLHNKDYSKEFYYGYHYLKENNLDAKILEFNKINFFFEKLEYLLSKYLSLPLYLFSLLNKQNFQMIRNSKNIVMVSESCGFAALPLLILIKKKYKIKTHLFVMGLFSKKINYPLLEFFHKKIINLLIKYIDNMYILGSEEYNIAMNRNVKSKNIYFSPFYVDNNFWKFDNLNIVKNDSILFVGNDSNRDFELLVKISKAMSQHNFIFITSNSYIKNIENELNNVQVVHGNWSSSSITDRQMLNYYKNSRIVILPLKNSTQPSGQSVTMQAMSVGIPVMISKTNGFWDDENFIDNENILMINSNKVEVWVNKLNEVYSNFDLLRKISKNSIDTINIKFDFSAFESFILGHMRRNINDEAI